VTRVTSPRRGRRPTRRLDLAELRELLRDRRVWAGLARVILPEGQSAHWEIVAAADGSVAEILVDVVLLPSNVEVTARLAGAGVWAVPEVGDEVIVHIPDGLIDFAPTIVGLLPQSGLLANGDQAPAPQRIVVAAPEVLVHDGTGGATSLALKSDVQDLADWIGTEMIVVTPSGNSTPGTTTPPPDPNGTEVLKAK
jgi:hypothetical protein